LEEENHRLKQMYADGSLDLKLAKEIIEKKSTGCTARWA
jgi:hypothetical protein